MWIALNAQLLTFGSKELQRQQGARAIVLVLPINSFIPLHDIHPESLAPIANHTGYGLRRSS